MGVRTRQSRTRSMRFTLAGLLVIPPISLLALWAFATSLTLSNAIREGAPVYEPDDIRIALDLDPCVPIVLCDARQRDSVKRVLTTLVSHVLEKIWPGHELQETPLPAT